jgi:molybdopterin synthase catalytic subunit
LSSGYQRTSVEERSKLSKENEGAIALQLGILREALEEIRVAPLQFTVFPLSATAKAMTGRFDRGRFACDLLPRTAST